MTDVVGLVIAAIVAIITGIQFWIAIKLNGAAAERQRLEDRQMALTIHEELTSLEVQQAKLDAPTSTAHHAFLQALYERSTARYGLVRDLGNLRDDQHRPYLKEQIEAQLAAVESVDPEAMEDATAHREGRPVDRSRYTWAGAGSYPKHQVLQKVATELAARDGLTGRAQFITTFAEHLRQALPDERPPAPDKILAPVATSDGAHQRVARAVGPLVLQGEEYVVQNLLGFSNSAGYGARIQLPVIEHFRSEGFPIALKQG